MKKPFLAILVFGIALSSCKSSKDTTSASSIEGNDTEVSVQSEPKMLASIERTACYGQCPMYKATFMDNGEVIYVGKRFVDKLGTFQGLISSENVLLIKKNIVEYDYFGLDSLYPTPVTDFPSCITEASLNGNLKKVIDRRNPPQNLKDFEKFLDSLLNDLELEKVSDNTNYQRTDH